ncbi:MAG: hypothetical protein JXA94_06700 [Parachlamydiales bacterium]|nr:hypothetical protein [Parachlamydiales bacterium]
MAAAARAIIPIIVTPDEKKVEKSLRKELWGLCGRVTALKADLARDKETYNTINGEGSWKKGWEGYLANPDAHIAVPEAFMNKHLLKMERKEFKATLCQIGEILSQKETTKKFKVLKKEIYKRAAKETDLKVKIHEDKQRIYGTKETRGDQWKRDWKEYKKNREAFVFSSEEHRKLFLLKVELHANRDAIKELAREFLFLCQSR